MAIPPRLTARAALDLVRHPRWLSRLWNVRDLTFANFADLPGKTSMVELGAYVNAEMMNPATDWRTLEWLRGRWDGPLAVKGVLRPDDALRAVELGADGVIVSNHGGRQLDGARASLDALPSVAEAVAGRADVLLDGGIRRGTDVAKAVALGARAVLVGRPYLYGLAAGGSEGVSTVLGILREEIDRTCALLGVRSVEEIDADLVVSGS
jgi:L-lactate dehydrogenase (cytochrome)/(S)-mandelate dehydrogenase